MYDQRRFGAAEAPEEGCSALSLGVGPASVQDCTQLQLRPTSKTGEWESASYEDLARPHSRRRTILGRLMTDKIRTV
jgi:hypothetical protein